MHRGILGTNRAVLPGSAALKTDTKYIAVRSELVHCVPFLPWTVLAVQEPMVGASPSELIVNSTEFGLRAGSPIVWREVNPPQLDRVVLAAPPEQFSAFSSRKDDLKAKLPRFVSRGQQVEGCTVVACEPCDQGLLSSDFTLAVVESVVVNKPEVSLSLEPFLEMSPVELFLDAKPLTRLIPAASVLPPTDTDLENVGFVHLSELAKLGAFSGDSVLIRGGESERYIKLHSHPDTADVNNLYISPILLHNLGNPKTVHIKKASSQFETAKEVVLSRVSSPDATDKGNQAAFLRGLKAYFSVPRIVANNDLIAVPINSALAKLVGSNGSEEIDLIPLVLENSKPDAVVWFEVSKLPTDAQYIVNPARTHVVQSGLVQWRTPQLNWRPYVGLPQLFDYFGGGFEYAHILEKLLRASTTPRGAAMKTTVLVKSSKRGAGKNTVLHSVASKLGVHVLELDAHDLIGDSDTKTLALIRVRLERAATTSPCLVVLRHFEALAEKNDVNGKDTPLVNGVVDVLDECVQGIVLAATVNDPDKLSDSVRSKFKFEVDVTVPSELERQAIFRYLTIGLEKEGGDDDEDDVCLGVKLRGDVSVDSMAQQSAGLTPLDLQAIVRSAKHSAVRRSTPEMVLCSHGYIIIEPQDLALAISDARDKFSDSIGAPKIPNVGWKDVGGLDMVKGEILDTIEMPLKHPELFASGLKKRSGILFYGPPGTGKTLLAKAIATNFSLNFFSVKGPELLNMYIGESEANVRRIFQKARDAKPCVVFFDELDSVAPKRGNKGDSGGVMDRIVSQLLAELDGMNAGSDGVFCVGATNRPDLLDEALLRPGRFDKMLYLGVSDTHDKQRTILEALTRKFVLAEDVDLAWVANECPFTYTGADFYALSSDAMLNAMTRTAGEIDGKIAKYNERHEPITIRRWFQTVASDDDVKVKVAMADFQKALRELVPSVSADELQHYFNVRKTFERN